MLKYAKDAMPSVWGRYVHRTSNPKLGFTDHDEWIDAPDYGSYFGDALVHYAGLFPDSAVAGEAQKWAAQLVASQDSDGYIGGFTFKARWQCWLEVFSQSLLINALLFRYDCTGDGDLLKTCERAGDHILETWSRPPADIEMGIFSGHGAIIVRTMGKLYAATGNDRYREFGQTVLDRYGRAKDYLAGGDRIVHDHNAVATEHIGLPAAVYEYTGKLELLKASEAAWEMMQPYLSVDGTPHGNEMIFNVGSRANGEHCGAVEWMITSRDLSRITGRQNTLTRWSGQCSMAIRLRKVRMAWRLGTCTRPINWSPPSGAIPMTTMGTLTGGLPASTSPPPTNHFAVTPTGRAVFRFSSNPWSSSRGTVWQSLAMDLARLRRGCPRRDKSN